jgi:hypothetical protein
MSPALRPGNTCVYLPLSGCWCMFPSSCVLACLKLRSCTCGNAALGTSFIVRSIACLLQTQEDGYNLLLWIIYAYSEFPRMHKWRSKCKTKETLILLHSCTMRSSRTADFVAGPSTPIAIKMLVETEVHALTKWLTQKTECTEKQGDLLVMLFHP